MGSIQTSSIRDLNRNSILYVGRPTDWRKGLPLFFEALLIVEDIASAPPFCIWIVGGSDRECHVIKKIVDSSSVLRSMHTEGRIRIWGRVENTALPELFSRAAATIIPSHREEFGIVAVESMMCGCPVVAARVGGLRDVVAHGITGLLFDPDNPLALAAAILLYLRNREMADLHGQQGVQWARQKFSVDISFGQMEAVYQANKRSFSELSVLAPEANQDNKRRQFIETRLGEKVTIEGVARGNNHEVVFFSRGADRLVAKFFQRRASQQASIIPQAADYPLHRGGRLAFHRCVFNKENPTSVPILDEYDTDEPFLLFPRLKPAEDPSDKDLLTLVEQCGAFRPLKPRKLSLFLEAGQKVFDEQSIETITAFDKFSSEINSAMNGGHKVFTRTHPQIELLRFHYLLKQGAWPLPPKFAVRALQAVDRALEEFPFIWSDPKLANADMKPEHILLDSEDALKLADFEHSRYVCGALDYAIYLTTSLVRLAEQAPPWATLQKRLNNAFESRNERILCTSWVLAEILFYAILKFSEGRLEQLNVASTVLRDVPLDLNL